MSRRRLSPLSIPGLAPGNVMAAGPRRGETSITDIQALVEGIGEGFTEFRESHDERLARIEASLGEQDSELRNLVIRSAAQRTSGVAQPPERMSPSDKKAFAQYCRTGQYQALSSTDSNPDGGYTVGETLDSEIAYLARNASPMRSICRVVQAKGRYSKLVNMGTSSATWRGERSPVSETTGISFAEVSPPEGEMTAQVYCTNWLLDDSSFDIASEITGDITLQFVESENSSFVNGDGSNKPRGFLTMPQVPVANWTWGKLGTVKSGDASGFLSPTTTVSPADCLIDLKNALHPVYRANAHWVMNSNTFGVIQKFKDTEGRYVVQTSLVQGSPDTLLGYPIAIEENAPDIGSGKTPIAFGDFGRGYLILDRYGMQVLRDPYSSKGNTIFFATRRVGGHVLDSKAIRLLTIAG